MKGQYLIIFINIAYILLPTIIHQQINIFLNEAADQVMAIDVLNLFRVAGIIIVTLLLAACGGATAEPAATPTQDPQVRAGEVVFIRECARCHSLVEDAIIVGPSMAGVASRAAERVPGQDAHTYLMTSIMRPGDYLVEGYQDLMPQDLAKSLTGEEIDQVVAFLLTLQGE